MTYGVDIKEEEMLSWGHRILETLLRDHTTDENIIWQPMTTQLVARGTPSMTRLRLKESAVMEVV